MLFSVSQLLKVYDFGIQTNKHLNPNLVVLNFLLIQFMNHFPNVNSIADVNKKLGAHTCRATLYVTGTPKEHCISVHQGRVSLSRQVIEILQSPPVCQSLTDFLTLHTVTAPQGLEYSLELNQHLPAFTAFCHFFLFGSWVPTSALLFLDETRKLLSKERYSFSMRGRCTRLGEPDCTYRKPAVLYVRYESNGLDHSGIVLLFKTSLEARAKNFKLTAFCTAWTPLCR